MLTHPDSAPATSESFPIDQDLGLPPVSELRAQPLSTLIDEWERITTEIGAREYHGVDFYNLCGAMSDHGQLAAAFLQSRLTSTHPYELEAAIAFLPFVSTDLADCIDRLRPLMAHPDGRVRASTVTALRNLSDFTSLEAIRPLLDDPDWMVQNAALGFLVKAAPVSGIAEAVTRLKDPHPQIRAHAIDVIDELEDIPASDGFWDLILPLIGDRDRAVRAAARWYLISRVERALPDRTDLHLSPVEWIRAVDAAWLAGCNGMLAATGYRRDPHYAVRLNLVEALASPVNWGQYRSALEVEPGLFEFFARDPDPRVREAALDLPDS